MLYNNIIYTLDSAHVCYSPTYMYMLKGHALRICYMLNPNPDFSSAMLSWTSEGLAGTNLNTHTIVRYENKEALPQRSIPDLPSYNFVVPCSSLVLPYSNIGYIYGETIKWFPFIFIQRKQEVNRETVPLRRKGNLLLFVKNTLIQAMSVNQEKDAKVLAIW